MVDAYLIPQWFSGFDIALELIFAIITMVIAFYAFKIYKLTCKIQCDKEIKLFGTSFLLISLAYLSLALLNVFILDAIGDGVVTFGTLKVVGLLNSLAIILYIGLFMAGLITLAYLSFRFHSSRLYILLLVIALFGVAMSFNKLYAFHMFTNIILLFVSLHYFDNYLRNKSARTMMVFAGFALLLIGNILFNISIGQAQYYAFGHIFCFVAYLLLLTNLVLAVKK